MPQTELITDKLPNLNRNWGWAYYYMPLDVVLHTTEDGAFASIVVRVVDMNGHDAFPLRIFYSEYHNHLVATCPWQYNYWVPIVARWLGFNAEYFTGDMRFWYRLTPR
jgi:hypothetical protein